MQVVALTEMAARERNDSDRTVKALAYISRELQGCFGHLATVLDAILNGEELPSSLFAAHEGKGKGKPRKQRSDKGEKRTRKPTAFNIFVKRKLEAMKAAGTEGEPKGPLPCFALLATQCLLPLWNAAGGPLAAWGRAHLWRLRLWPVLRALRSKFETFLMCLCTAGYSCIRVELMSPCKAT